MECGPGTWMYCKVALHGYFQKYVRYILLHVLVHALALSLPSLRGIRRRT